MVSQLAPLLSQLLRWKRRGEGASCTPGRNQRMVKNSYMNYKGKWGFFESVYHINFYAFWKVQHSLCAASKLRSENIKETLRFYCEICFFHIGNVKH